MKRILLIDGNYFAMRVLGQLNIGDSSNNLESNFEVQTFQNSLNASLINLYATFNNENQNLVDQVIFAVDGYSWRKEVPPHRPYYIDEVKDKRPVGYKENRKEKKEESSINYDNFNLYYSKFVESIKEKVHVFNIKGLEGDDEIMLISNKLAANKDVELIVFCTDGDLVQTVKNNCLLLRNIRSGECPNGEFVISAGKYTEIFEKSAKDAFFGNSLDISYYNRLFAICIGNIHGNSKIPRSLNKGISIATPFKTALIKSICGDKKDNIFSILAWKSTTGTMEFKITEKIMEKALKVHGYPLTENVCQKILGDKEILINVMLSLREVTKQNHVPLESMGKHLKHNLKMIVLAKNNLPENYLEDFNKLWDEKESSILTETFDQTVLRSMNVTTKDSATDIFEKSMPDIDSILKA